MIQIRKLLEGREDIGLLDEYHSSTQTSSCFRFPTLRTACLLPHPFLCEFAFPFSCRAARGNGVKNEGTFPDVRYIYSYLVYTKATLNNLNTGNSYLSGAQRTGSKVRRHGKALQQLPLKSRPIRCQ